MPPQATTCSTDVVSYRGAVHTHMQCKGFAISYRYIKYLSVLHIVLRIEPDIIILDYPCTFQGPVNYQALILLYPLDWRPTG